MLLPRGMVGERGGTWRGLDPRQNQAPCPQGNGTTIGSVQDFTLLCNTNVEGDVMERPDAFDFNACVDLCSSFHPKCEAISFNDNTCLLKNNLQIDRSRPARRFDSAVAQFPGATSNCPDVGAQQVIGQGSQGSSNFDIRCGTIIAGFDIAQNFAPTFQDCMGQCAATSGCAAVSFDASQNDGFKNCYLKTTIADPSLVVPQLGIDSGIISGAAASDGGGGGGGGAAAPVGPVPGVTTVPVPQPSVGGGVGNGGAVFFTPPGGSVAVPVPAPAPAPSADAGNTATAPATTAAPDLLGDPIPAPAVPPVSFTQGIDLPGSGSDSSPAADVTPSSGAALENSNGDDGDGGGSSNAWIAAPVVGSIAALVLIVLSFIMIKRRRRGSGSSSSSSSRNGSNISRPSPVSALFTTWLPSAGRFSRSVAAGVTGRGGGSGRNSKMGNFSEVTGQQMSGGGGLGVGGGIGSRGSVVGFFRPGGMSGGMERLDDIEEIGGGGRGEKNDNRDSTPVYDLKEGKLELRNSLNGLGQNRWS